MNLWGLTIRVNPLFLLILFLFFLLGMIVEVFIAFSLVIVHEFAHMLAANLCGFKVKKIEIFPFGGMAEYNGLLEMEPWQEIKVSLAGPFINVIFALILYFLIKYGVLIPNIYLNLLFEYNLIIASINLIPALPLDGGRVLRALLILHYGIRNGNKIALKVARFFAILGIIFGIFVLIVYRANIWLLFFFFSIYGMINREEKQLFYYFLQYLSKRNDDYSELDIKQMEGQVVSEKLFIKDLIYYMNPVKYNLYFILDINLDIKGVISESQLLKSYFSQKDKQLKIKDII